MVYGPLLAAWGLGLGAHLSSWSALVVAVATWTLTVGGALLLERAGRRGPAETLLRRLAYAGAQGPPGPEPGSSGPGGSAAQPVTA